MTGVSLTIANLVGQQFSCILVLAASSEDDRANDTRRSSTYKAWNPFINHLRKLVEKHIPALKTCEEGERILLKP